MPSILIRGAAIVDGSGSPPFQADVAVAGGRIAAVGLRLDLPSATVVDGGGLVLAPGFIDIHSHTDMTLFRHPVAASKLFQGVTTEVTGNCGLGLFPVAAGRESELADYLRLHDFHLPIEGFGWNDFAGWAGAVDSLRPALNVAPLAGHAPLRIAAMGMDDRAPSVAELEEMRLLLAAALRQGAWGLSTGLIYPPGSYAGTSELVALARTAADFGALYASHIRGESESLFTALEEAVAVGRESGCRIQVSHLKAMGRPNRGRAAGLLDLLAAARHEGIDVAADQYPYAASATTLSAVIPQWAHAGGVAEFLRRLREPELRERLAAEIDAAIAAREGAARIVVTNCRSAVNARLSGSTLAAVAAGWNCSATEAAIRLLVEEEGAPAAIFFSMAEEDVATIMADPAVAVGSDGHGLSAEADAGEPTHPRSFGTFPRVLGRYVREKGLLPLETAVRKMTGLPASRLGFTDRGLVREGLAADLVLFDPERIADLADYADPHRYSAGVVHLFVNGEAVIRDGALTGVRPGRVLRKGRVE